MKFQKKNLLKKKMSDYFKVKRPGLISTFQDLGRKNFYHIGLPFSGVMDKRNFLLLNKLCGNNLKDEEINIDAWFFWLSFKTSLFNSKIISLFSSPATPIQSDGEGGDP